ncbi:MAG: hypothetical protein JRJ09_08115 [Deltaproteobacteria bacterium]|nr:hypothetical protein [Deltaproteobacteria bacterium]MBW2048478.1 hypothetical protein [Deltaproteobacteria bacterium]MBW2111064.1 hypothetical protein [Deltaproteobacteria bacterium]MBW2353026.1 hypothetical protein [Deltaproteobacteria bacterium]
MLKKTRKRAAVLVIAAMAFFHCTATVSAEQYVDNLDEKGGYMAGDLLVIRPLGILATAAGSIIYVLSLPFSVAGGNEEEARQKLVIEPAKYTFTRPLGEL